MTDCWIGKPFLAYSQKTRGADGHPLHAETGYLRPVGRNRLEMVLVHPAGIAEIQAGSIEGHGIRLQATTVGPTPTAEDVRALTRSLDVVDGTVTCLIEMAAVGKPLPFHLEATLNRLT